MNFSEAVATCFMNKMMGCGEGQRYFRMFSTGEHDEDQRYDLVLAFLLDTQPSLPFEHSCIGCRLPETTQRSYHTPKGART